MTILNKPKLLVILGATAAGKSTLAVELAKKYGGEILSADSRQVYRGLDIGTGKITREEMHGVPHHLLDVANPGEYFSVADFKKLTDEAICTIYRINHLPILAGGTGHYIQAVVDNVAPPPVPPNAPLREKLSQKSTKELFKALKEKDPRRAETIEKDNPRRLTRALEIVAALGSVPHLGTEFPSDYSGSSYDVLQIGLSMPLPKLEKRIENRTQERLQKGWIDEVKHLHENVELSWKQIKEIGLGYRCIARQLQHSTVLQNSRIAKDEFEQLVECITKTERQYAKRQTRWFKRDSRIRWFSPETRRDIIASVETWLKK